jgi:hypothetical protein
MIDTTLRFLLDIMMMTHQSVGKKHAVCDGMSEH